jgi:hypothetical protein
MISFGYPPDSRSHLGTILDTALFDAEAPFSSQLGVRTADHSSTVDQELGRIFTLKSDSRQFDLRKELAAAQTDSLDPLPILLAIQEQNQRDLSTHTDVSHNNQANICSAISALLADLSEDHHCAADQLTPAKRPTADETLEKISAQLLNLQTSIARSKGHILT